MVSMDGRKGVYAHDDGFTIRLKRTAVIAISGREILSDLMDDRDKKNQKKKEEEEETIRHVRTKLPKRFATM